MTVCKSYSLLHPQRIPAELKTVVEESAKAVNFIKTGPLNSVIFAALCEEMGSDHPRLLPLTDICVLSRYVSDTPL